MSSIGVSLDQRALTVTFIADVAAGAALYDPARYRISSGRRLHPRVRGVVAGARANELVLHLDQPGDFSIYTLAVTGPDIDPFFAARRFSFKLECEDPFDCKPLPPPLAAQAASPALDYVTKDYAGFRKLLLDQLPARLPEWTERSEADLGVALVELFAEAADRLSYYQDRVANEAYLETATQRRSVELHTALIGHRMRPGRAAETFLFFEVERETQIAAGTQVATRREAHDTPVVFETGPGDFILVPRHNLMTPYAWGLPGCCLPRGATELAVVGDFGDLRRDHQVLIADAHDAQRREIVALAADANVVPPDPIKAHPTLPLTWVRWSEAQATQYEYCLDADQTLVRGNLVPATHGASVEHSLGVGNEASKRQRFDLEFAPLTYVRGPASQDPLDIQSSLDVRVDGEPWAVRDSLVESDAFDKHFRIELDDVGFATVVFGDGQRGQKPPTGAAITARYRVGIGPLGNVGRDTLITFPRDQDATSPIPPPPGITCVTNPLAAHGGESPDSRHEARLIAPRLIKTPIRCVTEADYERAATEYRQDGRQRVQRARARFVWTGSWHTVFVSVDPIGSETLSEDVRAGLFAYLHYRKLAGYDLEITASRYAPLRIALQVCVKPGFHAANVRTSLLNALSSRINADGSRGFFHPDNFTFGQPVLLSRLYAAVEAVSGVDSVAVNEFRRLEQRQPALATRANLDKGYVAIGEFEIARLDNDPSFPERGQLVLDMMGGR